MNIAAKIVVMIGYGWVGRDVALRAKGLGADVIVTEIDPGKALEARMDGFRVMPIINAVFFNDFFITTTSLENVLRIEIKAIPFKKPLLIRCYEFESYQDERGRTRVRKTDRLKDYTAPFLANFKIKNSVTLPKGYIFSANLKEIAVKLLQHGITVKQLCEPIKLMVQTFQIEEIKSEEQIFQGHKLTNIKGSYKNIEMEFL